MQSDNLLTVVGCGPGSPELVTRQALQAIERANIVAGYPSLLKIWGQGKAQISFTADINFGLEKIADALKTTAVTALVSGDCGCYSLAQNLVKYFGPQNCHLIPGISSIQLAASRLSLDWNQAKILSLHGRKADLCLKDLKKQKNIFILLGRDTNQASRLISELKNEFEMFLCSNLSLPNESIIHLDDLSPFVLPKGRSILVMTNHV